MPMPATFGGVFWPFESEIASSLLKRAQAPRRADRWFARQAFVKLGCLKPAFKPGDAQTGCHSVMAAGVVD